MANPNGHGGARAGAGRPRRDLATALENDVHKSKIKTTKRPDAGVNTADAAIADNVPTVPECRAYLTEEQKTDVELGAKEYFVELWVWLAERKRRRMCSTQTPTANGSDELSVRRASSCQVCANG